MMTNSHILKLFAVIFVASTLMTNIAFHIMGWDSQSNKIQLGIASIPSAKDRFVEGNSNGNNSKETGHKSNESVGVAEDVANGVALEAQKGLDKAETTTKSDVVVRPIELLLPPEEIEWIRNRNQSYFNFYLSKDERQRRGERWRKGSIDPHKHDINVTTGFTNYDEDRNGPWMDFIIAGHPKTGTTTLVANLANVAPMKVKDFCASQPSTLQHFVMDKWKKKFPEIMDGPNKYIPDKSLQLVGSKCPQVIGSPESVSRYTVAYPRMKFIIGIRHPIEWLNSFIRMGNKQNLYTRMKICPHFANIGPVSGIPGRISHDVGRNRPDHEECINECRCSSPVCFHRSRLHIGLARMGKTPLLSKERELLAPGDPDGGEQLFDAKAKNPIFVYDQTQMKEDSYWDELASFLGLSYIPNEHYHSSHGGKNNVTLCTPFYDQFRSLMMEHSYNMSVWLEDYFLPIGLDPRRPDVVIANTTSFKELIQTYKIDPCGRLVRNDSDGTYFLDPSFLIGSNSTTFEVHAGTYRQCRAQYPKATEQQKRRRDQKIPQQQSEGEAQPQLAEQAKRKMRRMQMNRKIKELEQRGGKTKDEHKRQVEEAIAKAHEAKRRHEASQKQVAR